MDKVWNPTKLNQYRSFGKCKYVHCKTVPNYEYAVVFLYEDCNMPKPTPKTTQPPPTQSYYWHKPTYATYTVQSTQNSYQPVLGQPVNNYGAGSYSNSGYGSHSYTTGNSYGTTGHGGTSYGTGYGATSYGNSYQPLFDQNKIQNYYEKQMKKEVNKLYREIING